MNKQAKSLDSGSNGQLSEKMQRLIPFIIGSHTVEAGCKEAGISTVTYYEYLKNELFAKELKRARDNAVGSAMETLKNATTKAVNELVTLLDSKDENIRRRAAVDVLTFITKWREFNEIEDRLVQIERIVIERKSYS